MIFDVTGQVSPYLLDIYRPPPEVISDRVASVRGLDRGRVHELPRRHFLEHGDVVVSVGREKPGEEKATGTYIRRKSKIMDNEGGGGGSARHRQLGGGAGNVGCIVYLL